MQADFWQELRSRRAQLEARLLAAPLVTIDGIADSTGVAAVKFQGDEHWTLKLTLEAWRLMGEAMQDGPLSLQRTVTPEDLEFYKKTLHASGQFRLKVRLLMIDGRPEPVALLEGTPLDIDDYDLTTRAQELQVSVTYQDNLFGTCVLDKRTDRFDAKADWNGTQVRVHLNSGTIDALPPVLEHAYELWRNAATWTMCVLDRAADDLLKLKNAAWLENGEHAWSADEFRQQLTLQSISIDKDAAVEFCFSDGRMFLGHHILVRANLDRGPTEAYIAG
jgi:hypothetical protein